MLRVVVHTTIASATSRSGTVWFVIEVEAETVSEIYDYLCEHGAICGKKLVTEQDEDGVRRIVRRDPMIISANVLATIGTCHFEYAEAE